MSLFQLVVQRPVATWMIAIAAGVFGLVSYERLPLALMPDMAYPTITVRTDAEGYAPEEVENQVSRRIEEALATTPGLMELESRSRAGTSDVVLEFAWGSDMDKAAQTIREQLQTTFLPDDIDRPLILRFDPNLDPVMRIALSLDPELKQDASKESIDLLELRQIADREIKRVLEAMDGIASVRIRGGLESEVRVEVREDWLQARNVTIDQVIATLQNENVNLPGGAILEGHHEYLVRTVGELASIEEIAELSIRRADGVIVPLAEVATISEASKDREVVSRIGGQDAVEMEIYKSAGANIVHLSAAIRDRIGINTSTPMASGDWPTGPPSIADKLPDSVQLIVLDDQAGFIEASLSNLRSTAMIGAVLAVMILFLFLRDFRATAIIATAIPLSIICTFAPMYLGSVSLNLMSLGGLALGIGMLVDNAVVVLENIHAHRERGEDRKTAAVEGTRDVAAAVTASTLTTVCVFLPIAFVEGVAGQLFGDLSLTVVYSLLASLVVALLFVPMLAAHDFAWPDVRPGLRDVSRATRFLSVEQLKSAWHGRTRQTRWLAPWWFGRFLVRLTFEIATALVLLLSTLLRPMVLMGAVVLPKLARSAHRAADRFHQGYDRFDARYAELTQVALAKPGQILGLTAIAVGISLPLFGNLGQSLIPELHQGRFTAELSLPVGTPLSRTIDRIRPIENALADHPDIAHLHTVVGTEQRADSRPDEGEHTARLMVELKDGGDLVEREGAIMSAIRSAAATTEGAVPDIRFRRPSLFSFRTPIEVVVYDSDLDRLRSSSDQVTATLAAMDGLTDVQSSLATGYPEVRIHYDRTLLSRFGLTTAQVAGQVRDKVLGTAATTLNRGEGRVDLTVRLDPMDRRGVEQLTRININPDVVPAVPLSSVATFEEAIGPSEIRRVDQRRAVAVSANMTGFDLSGRATEISQAIDDLDIDSEWELAGQNREMQRSLNSMRLALGLAIFLVYVIMASTFESVLHPFVILLSVPLAVVGVVPALFVTNTAVSVVVLIGAIVLSGVVVNNAIVLVDTINRHRIRGMERSEAIRTAASLRLRPILITTLTTVLGLTPLALGLGEGSEIQRPLAWTIISGLATATLLTLVVIPVVYQTLTAALERAKSTPEVDA